MKSNGPRTRAGRSQALELAQKRAAIERTAHESHLRVLALEQQSAVLALAGRFAESGAAKKAALAEADAQAQPRKLGGLRDSCGPAEDPCRLCARRCPRRAFLRRRLRDDFLAAPFCGEFLYPAKGFLPLLNLRLAKPRSGSASRAA